MSAVEKRDIRELFGTAVNASRLTLRENAETPLLRVAAMGAAAAVITAGADREGVPVSGGRGAVYGTPPDPRDVLAGEFAPMLWHIRYGGRPDSIPRAITLFAGWIATKHTFTELTPARIRDFSARVMHEWLSDRCPACGGSRVQERTRRGNLIKPRGSMQRNAVFCPCNACGGTGQQRPSEVERARAIGLERADYEAQGWSRRFTMARTWLNAFAHRARRPLTVELERGKRRP